MTTRLPPHALDPGSASDGWVATVQADGTVAWEAPAGSSVADLDDLADVAITGPADGDVLTYDSGSTLWVPAAPAGGGGGTAVRSWAQPNGALARKYEFTSDVQSWTASAGTLAHDAVSARLKHTVAATGTNYILLEPSGSTAVADGELVYDLSERTGSANPHDTGPVFRATDANNHYMIQIRLLGGTNGTAIWYKRVAGTYTSLGTTGIVQLPVFPGSGRIRARVMVRFVGSWIGVWLNEVFLGALNDTTYTTGRIGLWNVARTSTSEATYYDNVAAYTLSSTWDYPAYD